MKKIILYLILIISTQNIFAQKTFKISGKITNQQNEILSGATVSLYELNKTATSNNNGDFEFSEIPAGEYHLHISYLGYKCVHYNIVKIENSDVYVEYKMQPDNFDIDEIKISANSTDKQKREKTTATEIIDEDYISKNINSSLMKSLDNLPGISSMEVGQGLAKPVIRGLSFNRVAVSERGIKMEGQQWGADHGLEIDQYSVENLEIIKGPASLIYGSDAIGGVVRILPHKIPKKNSFEASATLVAKSLNMLYGGSLMGKYRKNDWHYYLRYSQNDFGDYKVPADSFFYNNFRLPIENQSLKNTAGHEKDVFVTVGTLKKDYKSSISVSNVNSVTGFFPGSHGIPDASDLVHDGSYRNLELPYQLVNHFKVISNSKIYLTSGSLEIDFGFQNNKRQEWSEFHTHYPTQEMPEQNPNLELEFVLNTWSAGIKHNFYLGKKHEITSGIGSQHQVNDIGGYMFLLPEYNRTSSSAFVYDKFKATKNLILTAGIRFDFGLTNILPYYSIYSENYKSKNFTAKFYDLSWATGMSYNLSKTTNLKLNAGKSFRMPNASELSANGIHHGSFRYEVGDTAITSEYSYQLDAGIYFANKKFRFEVSPFANYFPNFIYLSPTGSYLHPEGYEISEADAGQVYQYVQSEALRVGGEIFSSYQIFKPLEISASGEYVYASDFNYPIPFTPPLTFFSEINYQIPKIASFLQNSQINLQAIFSSAQNRNARNEYKTPAYQLYNASISTDITIEKINVNVAFQVQNILDTKYFNHLSFYRMIELPEAGRNFQLVVKIPFRS